MDFQDEGVHPSERPIQSSFNLKKVLGLLLKNPEVLSYLYSVGLNENLTMWKIMSDASEEIIEILKAVEADVNEFLKLIWEKIFCNNNAVLDISECSSQTNKTEIVLGLLLKNKDIPSIILSSDLQDSSIWEAMIDGAEELRELLAEFDVDVDSWCVVDKNNKKKTTFLHWLASSNDWENKVRIMEALIKIGADINAENDDNVTPLEIAIREGNLDCIEYLLFNDASLNSKSIIDLLLKKLELQDRKEMLKLLIKYDVNLLDDFWASEGENLLQFILNLNNDHEDVIEIAKFIVDAGVSVNDECECTIVLC